MTRSGCHQQILSTNIKSSAAIRLSVSIKYSTAITSSIAITFSAAITSSIDITFSAAITSSVAIRSSAPINSSEARYSLAIVAFTCFFKKMGQSRPLFVYFRYFLITISIIEKSIDGVLGIQTRGRRMVGADETTEL